jgi:nucleoside-diphosphate-sugar epimerase
MKVFMIGGTGLIGSAAAEELLRRGHSVASVALPPLPEGARLPPEMKIDFANYMELTDDALRAYLTGCDGLVFAAGVDERVEGVPPVYEMFKKYNITPLERLLRLAKECGVRRAVICGSYFTYFDTAWPEKHLSRNHPYIRSRVDQEKMALSFSSDIFDVAVLELPYIFGTQPGRKPVWVFLVEMVRKMRWATFYPRGGSAMVTLRQVAMCVAGALERVQGGRAYPVGYYNLTWREMLVIVHKHMGVPGKRIVTIPGWLFALSGRKIARAQEKAGHEGGLNMRRITDVMCSNAFIGREIASEALGVPPDDLDAAIGASVRLCLEVLDGKTRSVVMKGE